MRLRYLLIFFVVLAAGSFSLNAQQRTESMVTIDGAQYYVHTVAQGETVYSLARLYNVSENILTSSNPHIARGLQTGMVLKVPVDRSDDKKLNKRQEKRTFDTHTVREGETLYAIASRYGISVGTLMEDNAGLDPMRVSIGQQIRVRKASQGDTSGWEITEEFEDYRDAINRVTPDGQYYLVKSGDTLYSLGKTFGVTVEDIELANDIRGGLRAGSMIKIPGESLAVIPVPGDLQTPQVRYDNPRDSIARVREQMRDRANGRGKIAIEDISGRGTINISLLLPLENNSRLSARFLEFYRGVLLGLEDLKEQGTSANLNVFNLSRYGEEAIEIVGSEEFKDTDLIIGPVYEDGLFPIITFAESQGIPVISPLQQHESVPSPVLYQMAPSVDNKYDKLISLASEPDVNVIYLSTGNPDAEMDSVLRRKLPVGAKMVNYTAGTTGSQLESHYDRKAAENIFIVSCTDIRMVDQILGKISSVYSNLFARSLTSSKVKVVGGSNWAWFPGSIIDRDLYFKLGVCYVTNYHVDRSNDLVREFDRRYIEAFGAIPPSSPAADPSVRGGESTRVYPYAYRGYDAVKLFGGAMMTRGDDYTWKINGSNQTLLQVSYKMEQTMRNGDFRNTNWVMVCYGPDYTIHVK